MKRSNGSATPVTVMVTGAAALALAAGLAGCHNASDSSPTGRGDTTATTPMNPDSPTLPNSDWSPYVDSPDSGSAPGAQDDPQGTTR
jgi:hypothetical protein